MDTLLSKYANRKEIETSLCIQSDYRPWIYYQKMSLESTGKGLSCFAESELQHRF